MGMIGLFEVGMGGGGATVGLEMIEGMTLEDVPEVGKIVTCVVLINCVVVETKLESDMDTLVGMDKLDAVVLEV